MNVAMNVWPAYEEPKEALGPEASRKVAMGLDALAQEHVRTADREVIDPLPLAELAAEQRLTELRLNQRAETVHRTGEGMVALTLRMGQPAKAQPRTESRSRAPTERVDRFAETQRRTEEAVQGLSRQRDDTDRLLGVLSMTAGHTLENAACRSLPPLLERHYGLRLRERLRRGWLLNARRAPLEGNILGRGDR